MRKDLKLNISNRRKDLIFGEKWLEFKINSKAVLEATQEVV